MRWEEIWDAALRIRNQFAKTTLPEDMRVDGSASPDRRIFSNISGGLLEHQPTQRDECFLQEDDGGLKIAKLSLQQIQTPPLNSDELSEAYRLG